MKVLFFIILIIIKTIIIGQDYIIDSIEVTGLKRTSKAVVFKLIDVEVGDCIDKFNEEEFKDRILKTGIFSAADIKYNKRDTTIGILINVKEQWTLVGLPMVSIGDVSEFGLFMADTNFLGMQKTLGAGFIYSTDNEFLVTLGFTDKRFFTDYLGIVTSITVDNRDSDKKVNIETSAGIIKSIGQDLSITNSIDYRLKNREQEYKYVLNNISFILDQRKFRSDLATGGYHYLSYYGGWGFREEKYVHDITADLSYTINPLINMYLTANFKGSAIDKPEPLEIETGGKDFNVTMEPIFVDRYLSGSIYLDYTFVKFSWGTFSAITFIEHGIYNKDHKKIEKYGGPGCGLKIYLKDIAIPALGILVGYNVYDKEYRGSVSIGFQM